MSFIQLVWQYHGQIVVVPPGTIHCVVNLQTCMKVAWEINDPAHLGLYFQCLHYGGVEFFLEKNAADYMVVGAVMKDAIRGLLAKLDK